MSKFPTECPSCSQALDVTRLSCPGCAMQLEGRFELPLLLRLPSDDVEFIVDFLRCSGSLKDVGKLRGQSYPTVRARLDAVIERLSANHDTLDAQRKKILDALSKGELSVKDASKKLKELGS
ncbi:DUF2089 domain-containing protein [Vitiosangium sp. GDMCC 1.1324]|uniref:DUF2089 domain-containing protein n=1 Tax=Vitiosangium sp. (strain GDMCC 1.1324) TaxID=2138576 RepID=UPI0011B40EFA|nr:DUF2089 domain-containing protein [Vitiosangium sp. GDMCC 1.1324]